MDNENRVKKIISEHLGAKNVKIDDSIFDLHADSLDHIEIVMALEEEFELEIADEDADKAETVRDFIGLVK